MCNFNRVEIKIFPGVICLRNCWQSISTNLFLFAPSAEGRWFEPR